LEVEFKINYALLILATDYDGTLALHGMVNPTTIASIKKVKAFGKENNTCYRPRT
jgi:hypothetical protein